MSAIADKGARTASPIRFGATGASAAAPSAAAAAPVSAASGDGNSSADDQDDAPAAVASKADDATANDADTTDSDALFATLSGSTTSAQTASTSTSTPAAGGAATASDLGAQIGQRADAGDSRFQLKLNPQGLGEVTVSVRIGADRQLSADLSFEHADAAAVVGAHRTELQAALEQAGFTLGAGGVGIAVHHAASAGQAVATTPSGPGGTTGQGTGGQLGGQGGGQGGASTTASRPGARAAAQAFANDDSQSAAPSAWGLGAQSRLDIRI